MRNYILKNRFCTRGVQMLLLLALLMPTRMFGAGFTPTDGGLVVNLQKDDRFLLSVWVDKDKDGVEDEGEEYFVENYSRYTGDSYFKYDSASYILKLVPQGNVTKPSSMSIWTVDTALTRVQGGNNYSLGGISYTMWNDGRTIRTDYTNNLYQFYGDITTEEGENAWKNEKICDVVFVIPTDYSGIVSFDPDKTMNRADQSADGKFNGKTGTGFLGMTYREVYWLEIPRFNGPVSYTNAAVVTINTTKTNTPKKRCGVIKPGRTAYAYANDGKKTPDHSETPRTIFRLYLLDDPIVACPNTYFFAYDEQYRGIKYRKGPGTNPTLLWTDSTVAQTVYTMDRLFRMDRIGETKEYQTGLMKVPVSDSSLYYVGYDNDYRNGSSPTPPLASERLGSSTAKSEFARIRQLPMYSLAGKYAPAGACGRMIIDTTSNADNLNVKFQPAGYFLKVSTGKNVRLKQTAPNVWTCDEMWTITSDWSKLKIKATLMTGGEFSESDPGADVAGWSEFVTGTSVPVADRPDLAVTDQSGWARITTNDTDPNGHIEFVLANPDCHIHYDNNGLQGLRLSDQYPVYGSTSVTIQTPEVSSDYTFSYWTTNADGTGTSYDAGDVIDLPEGRTTLYAQGTYKGSYNVALSFIHTDGKRYYMTHPGAKPPRYSRARHYDDWTNVWQGMADVNNNDPNFLSSFELRHPSNEIKEKQDLSMPDMEAGEYVLDPRHYTVKGAIDSLTYYEFFKPGKDEYLCLYYTSPNTILANDTWAGLFKTTSTATTTGWPDFKEPYISGAKLRSSRYVEEVDPVGHPDELTLKIRGNNVEGEYVKYNASENQFDACVDPSTATVFDIATINVADEYFVVLPDTTEAWHDRIDFGYHTEALPSELVWLKLIGKQLMAFMRVGADTVYFHPNNDKIYSTSRELASSSDFRLTQSIAFIRDARVTSVDVQDRPSMELADEYSRYITSGSKSPMEVKYRGRYVDIYDTLRITLTQGGISKIKKYYGRWNDRAANLHLKGSSRYRDIIIHTNTYHHGDTIFHPVLTPVDENYTFNPLVGNSQTVNFKVTNYKTCKILDINNTVVDEIELEPEDITTSLALSPSACSFSTGGIFAIPEGGAVSQQVTLKTLLENKTADNIDSLKISTTVTINGVPYPVTASVPLIQTSLEGDELIWSVNYGGEQYYIMAGTGGLIFRKYNQNGTTLYKEGTKDVRLVKGSADAANSDAKYITPWHFSYNEADINQLKLQTQDGVNRYFKMLGDEVGDAAGLHETGYSYLTFEYVQVYTNANANEEEQVKLRYLSDKWLKFTGSALVLTDDVDDASVFSWSYPKQEYYIHQKHTYPERSSATFGYNTNMNVYIRTRYKAYKEYSMLVNNKQVDLCKEDEEDIADLIDLSQEWKTGYTITRIPDARTFDAGSTPYPAVSGLSNTLNTTDLRTTVSTSSASTSPLNVKFKGEYVNIVDTLHVVISLDKDAPKYKFAQDWSSFKSIKDAELKIPLIRTTYHIEEYDSIVCTVEGDEYNYTFPNDITDPVSHTFTFGTERHTGKNVLDVNNTQVAVQDADVEDLKSSMHLNNKSLAQVRLIDAYGDEPDWCRISGKTDRTVTVQCTQDGIRAPRSAYIYIAYIVTVDEKIRFVNFRVTVSQPSLYAYANNQYLVHSTGASGDALDAQGMQRVHQNKRILYYYPEQNVELPVRESHFFGWWRWFREGGVGIGDTDIPEANWRTEPLNMGVNSSNNNIKYNYPFRIIGNEVPVDPENPEGEKKLVTNGRYTVFHYKSSAYKDVRLDPPCKTALVAPPTATEENGMRDKPTLTYAVDISNYYDRLPMSVSQKNQVDTARLDTMRAIPEPTLSLREVFELRPWTEMAATMESYKSAIQEEDYGAYTLASERYMEDHVVMAPIGYQLLLSTEQRYNYANLVKGKHSESLLCYYMRDDNWSSMSSEKDKDGWSRQDSMIWCGGWDADCLWYTYDTTTQKYTRCTHKITDENDFLIVPKKENITAGQEFDTVYYCLRARSRKTETAGTEDDPDPEDPEDGDYMFNICRYKVIYHNPTKYGPKLETSTSGVKKAIITNDEIEQNYEVLERLNFDYNKPGSNYKVYPHPLPWADASYGYTYPETADLPHNRLHEQSDFPNMGEYGLINKIPYSKYWYTMEQHGGAENGYMIYCDGMSSAGQVAALSLTTQLCEGQKMYFSGYVGNCSNQKSKSEDAVNGKSEPNFTFSVQGSTNGSTWEDITTYMTGDLPRSSQWYQIYFPVNLQDRSDFSHFRVRIYNMSSSWDGNDFVIDDMCLFATKPPLIAYQANTECVENATNDSITQVVLRIDYQGFTNDAYNGKNVYYTIQQAKNRDTTYVELIDHYLNETDAGGTPKMIYGYIPMPARNFVPTASELIFDNLNDLVARVEESEREKESPLFRQGYIFEEDVEGVIRPVMYVIHKAKMASDINYKVRMSLHPGQLTNSICAMTSELKVTSHIVLELNGKEQPGKQVAGQCANTTYDIAMRVKGSLYPDNAAPIDLNGSCQNDWLLFGDTAKESSKARYGYYYSDIVKVIKDILRCEPTSGTNANQFAPNFSSVSRNEMIRIQNYQKTQGIELSDPDLDAYTILSHLVTNGFLTLYKPKLTATLMTGEELRYVVFPIVGTGSDAMHNANVDVCPNPVLINIAPTAGGIIPMSLGGIYRDATQKSQPMGILANELAANQQVAVRIDSLAQPQITGDIETSAGVAIHSIELRETDDPEYLEALHTLRLLPDREWVMGGSNTGYYVSGDTLYMRPAEDNNYTMRAGYSYTFNINLMNRSNGSLTVNPADASSCRVGIIPFTLSIVPDYIRWEPKSEKSSAWNNPDNWIGINARNEKIHDDAHFVPLASSNVIIPAMSDGLPYPVLPDLNAKATYDSIKQIGFEYNKCNVIRFMPGAAMGQQQRMNYNKAVIDLSTPQEKWALRSTPVKGMLSGDIFRANADISNQTSPWEVGSFDDNGRNKSTGNASFWISLYSRESIHLADGNNSESDTVAADTEWAKITNVMSLPLPSASGWAVFTRTASGREPNAVIRLPKNDDIYYYYDQNGQIWYDFYEQNLQTKREAQAVLEGGHAGELAFDPVGTSQSYTLTNGAESSKFVFGNPTMGYIDIWGFISDNTGLSNEFDYIDASGAYVTRNKATADATKDTITEPLRYLPPMHAIVLKAASAATSKEVTLNASRVVTVSARDRGASAPSRMSATGRRQGIMKVTAINPLTEESRSTLLIGQGYHNALRDGEDAMLTTININEYNSSAPTTLFNIYASEGAYGLCIDLLDEVVNVPVSFYMMKDVPFEPVTELWFSGVNNIDGELVFYDALTGSERTIADGICIKIPTPEQSHETRYYIRRRGFDPNDPGTAIATDIDGTSHFEMDGATAVKVIHNGHVLILRDGHVYTMFGQKLR